MEHHTASCFHETSSNSKALSMQERLQLIMSAQFAKQEAALKTRVAELEQKAAASGLQIA